MKAYKGFDKNMQCRGFQFEEGKTYTAEGEIKCCENGFHACENPLDVLHYYSVAEESKYHVVECSGDIAHEESRKDSKFACKEITVKAEVTLGNLVQAGLNAVFEKVRKIKPGKATQGDYSTAATQGYCSTAATQGYCSTAATQGDYSTAATQGYYSTAEANGKQSIALAHGYKAKAKGVFGCYLVLTEIDDCGELLDCQCRKVDGIEIKENTLYILKNGEFIEVND